MLRTGRLRTLAAAAVALVGFAAPARAAVDHFATNWDFGLQQAASPVFQQAHDFHNFVLIIITAITLFVLALLVYCVVRFHEARNPVPSKTTHHTMLEVVWTVLPVLILVVIAVPSFRLLYAQYTPPPVDMTIKIIGRQWNWDVVYPDANALTVTQIMLEDDELKPGQLRKLAVDNNVVLPVNKVVRVQVTAEDVMHAFAMPGFGVKVDAVPGRLNETWFKAQKEGVYYGQCSELCGEGHPNMPVVLRVVSEEVYTKWLEAAKSDLEGASKLLEQADAGAATSVAAR